MLEELYFIHREVVKHVPTAHKRYLYNRINWKSQGICILGARGVGKTTLLLQFLLERYGDPEKCLYLSADNINVISNGLFEIAKEYFKYGGKALIIDEIHKYPDWSLELKNIIDTFRDRQILISGSSSIDLTKSKYDLSRRLVYYELKGLSFREYLNLDQGFDFRPYSLESIIKNHVKHAGEISSKTTVLKEFNSYLSIGYYPYFIEGKDVYFNKLISCIEKVIYEDIAFVFNLKQPKTVVLKKMLWLIASSEPFKPNIDKISRELRISKEYVYHYLEYLELSGLIISLCENLEGFRKIRKPGKLYMENANLIAAISGNQFQTLKKGTVRETFFVNQTRKMYPIYLHRQADFVINDFVFEIGGKNKGKRQIVNIDNSWIVSADVEIGFGNKIPLYLFGFLY